MDRPEWWDWELELTAHVESRMEDREFSEIELRRMIGQASSVEADHIPDRWLLRTRHGGRPWAVIVEPDPETKTLVVITAYELER